MTKASVGQHGGHILKQVWGTEMGNVAGMKIGIGVVGGVLGR